MTQPPAAADRPAPPAGPPPADAPAVGAPPADAPAAGRAPSAAPHAGPPTVAVVGAGQLARMMQPAAIELGVRLRVLAQDPDDSAAQVVVDAPVGSPDDLGALVALARGAAALTLDHEQVPTSHLRSLAASGVAVRPGPDALEHAQDKLMMRRRLDAMGVAVPRWAPVADEVALAAFGDDVGWPVVLKTPRGGYDGKGVRVVQRAGDAADWFARAAASAAADPEQEPTLLAEELVPFARELAVLVARSPSGQAAAWPVVETVQVGGVCTEVVAPAPGLDEDAAVSATAMALRLAEELGVTGVMAVECFEVAEGATSRVVVNELAMRPHNSGHWTIDGSVTSQFEQHLRAVLDLPLGEVAPRARWSVMVNVFGPQRPEHADVFRAYLHVMAHDPGVKVHLYGKAWRPGRKVGHVTVCGDDLADVRARARHAGDFLTGVVDG